MRLVAKHRQVGYQVPSQRDGCRNCVRLTVLGEENGLGIAMRQGCAKHGIEVTSGGICADFSAVWPRADSQQSREAQVIALARAEIAATKRCDLLAAATFAEEQERAA
ncbi:TPA: hypothetical protein ACOEN8_000419 [Stenotrophomonas maltophilia]